MARYRGTDWESPTDRALTPALGGAGTAPRRSLRPLLLVGLVVLVVAALATVTLLAGQGGLLDQHLSDELAWLQVFVVMLVGGLVSLVVPGRRARGPFKSWLVGLAGWFLLGNLLSATTGWLPFSIEYLRGGVDHMLVSVAGASLLRLGLLFTE